MNPPREVDLRIDATWIVPVEPAGTLLDHALVIDQGRIVAIAPAAQVDADYAPRDRVTLPGHALIPGLVNAHTHTAMTLLRGIADDVPLKRWLEDHIWPREGRFVAPEFVYDGTLLGAAEMLRAGITCCNDMYFYPDASARAYEAAGMRALIGMPILDFPTPYAADADGYLQNGLAARDQHRTNRRLSFALAPHAPYTVGDSTWEKIVVFARELELPIQSHVAETRLEVEESIAATGETPLMRLHRLGATGPDFIAIHAVHLQDRDVDLLATHGCHVVHCPASNMKLASGVAPVERLRARGVNVALGTDGAASNNRLDVLAEARLASLLAKVTTGDAAALAAADALYLATLGGAKALGFADELGSLSQGKAADVVSIDLSRIATSPVYDPVSHIVHASGRENVSNVWIAGQAVVREGQLTLLDEAGILARTRAWQARLQ